MSKPIGNPNIAEAGKATRFSKSNPPKKPGRKPSQLKKWIKDFDLSKSDVNAVFKNFLYGKTAGEINRLLKDDEEMDKLPLGIALQLNILVNAAKKGDGRHLENIIYMLVGKPTQSIDIKQSIEDLPSDLEELEALEKYLDEKVAKLDAPEHK